MSISFPPLPYDMNGLEPVISKESLTHHYGEHHKKYVETLNQLIKGTPFDDMKLTEIVLEAAGREGSAKKIFNNAAQSWNHDFFWRGMTRRTDDRPSTRLLKTLEKNFGSFDGFLERFKNAGVEHFGSGYVWLVKERDKSLSVVTLSDAGNPLVHGQVPLLTCDLWEHSYYIDYRHERERYLQGFLTLIDWAFVEKNLDESSTDSRRLERRARPKTDQHP